MAYQLAVLRHGESLWNQVNRFTGWTDVDLTDTGIAEARHAAALLRAEGFACDVALTSVLKRAIRTTWIVLDDLDRMWIPVENDWRLNERHYGALQGLNKADSIAQFGEEQVRQWRRSYAVAPPPLTLDDPRHPRFDPRYAALPPDRLPCSESLAETLARVVAWCDEALLPHLRTGRRALVVAHGNSLRALIKHLEHTPDDLIPELYVPTGIPLVYDLDKSQTILDRRYLGDPTAVDAAIRAQLEHIRTRRDSGPTP